MPAKKEKAVATKAKAKAINFTCKFCEETKPISEMTVISRFFPPVAACKPCAKRLR